MDSIDYIDINELYPVGKIGDNIILMVLEKDKNNSKALSVQVDFTNHKFGNVQEIGKYLKFNNYNNVEGIEGDNRYKYQDWISKKISDSEIIRMIVEFTDKLQNNGK